MYLRIASGITRGFDDAFTAKSFAHEIGHNLGMSHDFETSPHRSRTCGPGKNKGSSPDKKNEIMNYGWPMDYSFSKCSNQDFKQYYTTTVGNRAKFCLNGKYFHFYNIFTSLEV